MLFPMKFFCWFGFRWGHRAILAWLPKWHLWATQAICNPRWPPYAILQYQSLFLFIVKSCAISLFMGFLVRRIHFWSFCFDWRSISCVKRSGFTSGLRNNAYFNRTWLKYIIKRVYNSLTRPLSWLSALLGLARRIRLMFYVARIRLVTKQRDLQLIVGSEPHREVNFYHQK